MQLTLRTGGCRQRYPGHAASGQSWMTPPMRSCPADSEGVEVADGCWYRLEGCRLFEGSVRAVLVLMSLESRRTRRRCRWFQVNVGRAVRGGSHRSNVP
jgi:hypothetical protein